MRGQAQWNLVRAHSRDAATVSGSVTQFLGIGEETGNFAGLGVKGAVLLGNLRILAMAMATE